MKSISELRQDIVSGDWIVIATKRAKRPHDFLREVPPPFRQPKRTCPFETLFSTASAVYARPRGQADQWVVQVIPNKYPAFAGTGAWQRVYRRGPYQWREGVGTHDVVVFRGHERPLAEMTDAEVGVVIRAYQERYLTLQKMSSVKYVSIFHNHGRQSGASIAHPHSQMIGLPVIPPDIGRSLKGSAVYFHAHRQCVHCVVARFERRATERLVYENDQFVVYAPFASRTAFELRILPKTHNAHFEAMSARDRFAFANALRVSLAKLHRGLKNPDYNFFVHTAPTRDSTESDHYHWHCEILPKTAIWAGFEIGTGIEISVIAPETAAAFLRKIKI